MTKLHPCPGRRRFGDVAAGGQPHLGMVRWHVLTGSGAAAFRRVLRPRGVIRRGGSGRARASRRRISNWCRASARARPGQGGRQARFALLIREAWVGGAQLQVGHQAVELQSPLGMTTKAPGLPAAGTISRAARIPSIRPDDVTDADFDFRFQIVDCSCCLAFLLMIEDF